MASTSIEVEAASPEQAIEEAQANEPHLCAACAGHGNPPGIDLSYDWEPTEVVGENGEIVWTEGARDA